MPLLSQSVREFLRLRDIYYWKTAVLIARNMLSKQYRNSFLGMLWTIIQPLTMVLVYSAIMPLIMRFPQEDYVMFIVSSLPLWSCMANTLILSGNSLLSQAETLKRCVISATVFPVAEVLKNMYIYLTSFTTMYLVCALILGKFSWTVLLVPLFLIPVIIILMAMATAIAFVAPYIRDISELIFVSMNIFVWLTPVLYPVTALPEALQAWMVWNPFFIMIHPIQMLAYEGVVPGPAYIARLIGLTALAVGVCYALYRGCRRNFVYYL